MMTSARLFEISLAPRFSEVFTRSSVIIAVLTASNETVETVHAHWRAWITSLKRGANENDSAGQRL